MCDCVDLQKNANRFTGFAEEYEQVRPAIPLYALEKVKQYLEHTPDLVVDLGCGTGLSTAAWRTHCARVIGIEPSDDMLRVAMQKSDAIVSFQKGFADRTGLSDGVADAVICSQSFHWMEPKSTLKEVNRILKSGGVFATVDCDWPPVSQWRAEQAYMQLSEKVNRLETELKDVCNTFVRYPKNKHLENIQASRYFRYSREIVFANAELCTAERFIGILFSQGGLQSVYKLHPQLLQKDMDAFAQTVQSVFAGRKLPIEFCYRMRIAVK